MSDEVVLDASAVIAYLFSEPGSHTVSAALGAAYMSAVNAGEVLSDLLSRGLDFEQAFPILTALPIQVVPHDLEQAAKVAQLKKQCPRSAQISRADCACLALAAKLGLKVLTADAIWSTLEVEVQVEQIR